MKVSVILAHPDALSLNHAIAQRIRETIRRTNHTLFFHDLYAEQFEKDVISLIEQ